MADAELLGYIRQLERRLAKLERLEDTGGTSDHGSLTGLGDDDHTQYLLAGAVGGRTAFNAAWTDLTDSGATTLHKHDHGGQDGLADDDHTQYLLASGTRSAAQSGPQLFTNAVFASGGIIGSNSANGDLAINGTSDATKTSSYVLLQPTGGLVGIGTTTPTRALDVNGVINTRGDQLLFEGGSGLGADQPDATATLYNRSGVGPTFSGYQVAFRTGATPAEIMRLDPTGLVGIGTSLPSAKLTVDQGSTTAAIAGVDIIQADLSEEFIDFRSSVGASNPIDTAAVGTYYGKIRVAINGTYKYIPVYNS